MEPRDPFPEALALYEAMMKSSRPYSREALETALARVRRGIPPEHEFAALARWGGAPVALPLGQEEGVAADEFHTPDLFIIAKVANQEVPFFVEVKSTTRPSLSLTERYVAKMLHFHESSKLPVLLALRTAQHIWVLLEVSNLRKAKTAFRAGLQDLPQSLMGLLLGERSLSLFPGARLEIVLMRADGQAAAAEGEAEFEITDAAFEGSRGRASTLPMWMDVVFEAAGYETSEEWSGPMLRQTFQIAAQESAEAPSQALLTQQLLAVRTVLDHAGDPFQWHLLRREVEALPKVDVLTSQLLTTGLVRLALRQLPAKPTVHFDHLLGYVESDVPEQPTARMLAIEGKPRAVE